MSLVGGAWKVSANDDRPWPTVDLKIPVEEPAGTKSKASSDVCYEDCRRGDLDQIADGFEVLEPWRL